MPKASGETFCSPIRQDDSDPQISCRVRQNWTRRRPRSTTTRDVDCLSALSRPTGGRTNRTPLCGAGAGLDRLVRGTAGIAEARLAALVALLRQYCVEQGLLVAPRMDPRLGRLVTASASAPSPAASAAATRLEAAIFDDLVSRPDARGEPSPLEHFLDGARQPGGLITDGDAAILTAYGASVLSIYTVEAEPPGLVLRNDVDGGGTTVGRWSWGGTGPVRQRLLGRVVSTPYGAVLMPSWFVISDEEADELVDLIHWLRDNLRKAITAALGGRQDRSADALVREGLRDAAPLLLSMVVRGDPSRRTLT